MSLDLVKHRDILGFVLNEMGLTGEMAEIGVCRGHYSKEVLSVWKGKRYHCIDPWRVQDASVYLETQQSAEDQESFYQGVVALAREDSRVNIIRELSPEAERHFTLNQLDCVYLDGNHCYKAVMADLDAWWPKVRIGGILGGHDFQNKTDEGWFCEVFSAVMRWTNEHGKVFYVSPCGSWWIHKTSP